MRFTLRFTPRACLLCLSLFLGAALALPGLAQEGAPREDPIRAEIDTLASPEHSQAACERLVKRGQEAVRHLLGEALEGNDLYKRGWSIVALGEIGGAEVEGRLGEMARDSKLPPLVRTWAAAAQVKLAPDINALRRLVPLASENPALGRPLSLRLIALSSAQGDGGLGALLELTSQHPPLEQALRKAITARAPEELCLAMRTHADQGARRQAASYLGLLAQRGDSSVGKVVIDQLRFDRQAVEVPWKGGPLFLPGIDWSREDARELVGQLMRWILWAERHSRSDLMTQLHNNVRSVGLAHKAGYQPAWNEQGAKAWLEAWKAVVGQQGIDEILREQDAR